MIVRRLGLGIELEVEGFRLALDPPRGYKGLALYSGTYPLKRRTTEGGSYGPLEWEVLKLEGLRNEINGFMIRYEGIRLLYAGGALEVPKSGYEVLALASGGTWYLDPLKSCKAFKESEANAFIPTALWSPKLRLPLEGLEEVRDKCRGIKRVRGGKVPLRNFETKTVILLE